MSYQAEFNFEIEGAHDSEEYSSPDAPYYMQGQSRKIFYVMLFKDPVVRSCLNIIRVIANPFTTQEAHVTIRGPYRGSDILYLQRSWKIKHENAVLKIDGSGRFDFAKEHVVFLSSSERAIAEDVWWKPDYQDGVVHVTLYSGPDERMADYIQKMLSSAEFMINTRLTKLLSMTVQNKGQQDFSVYLSIDRACLQQSVGMDLKLEDVYRLSFQSRARIIDRAWAYLLTHRSRGRL